LRSIVVFLEVSQLPLPYTGFTLLSLVIKTIHFK
jgi:hypothetical protein